MLSVGRCKFHLCADTVALMLQSFLGGNKSFFAVSRLGYRVFRFSVISKQVGLYIYNLKSFRVPGFKVNFHPWGEGGPNVAREIQIWEQEEEA